MKVFVRTMTIHDSHAGKIPYNVNIGIAADGFHKMGYELHFYENVSEIYDVYEKGDILLDGIDQVSYVFGKYGIKFPNFEYPDVLMPYLGRRVWVNSIRNVANNKELIGYFIKPCKHKAFTGHVIRDMNDFIGINKEENYDVIISEKVDFIFEVRGLVYYDQLIDLRPYRGSWENMHLIDTGIIKKAMTDWKKWQDRPTGCTLDWGVTKTGESLFIEGNSGCSFGVYSTNSIDYAKIISAAFSRASGTKDECYFGPINHDL